MSDQELKVGVVFEFKGIDDIDQLGETIEKAMKGALGQLGVKGGVLELRMANIDEFKAAVAEFNNVVKLLVNTLKNASISVQPANTNNQKTTGGQSSGAVHQQAMSQIGDSSLSYEEALKAASLLAKNIMTPLTPIERKLSSIKNLFTDLVMDLSEFERGIFATKNSVYSLEDSFSGFEQKFRNAMGGAGSMILKSVNEADAKFKIFGQNAVGGISIIDKTMSSMFRGNLNDMAKYLVSLGTEIDNQLAEAKSKLIQVTNDPNISQSLKDSAEAGFVVSQIAAEKGKKRLNELAQNVDRMDGIIRRQEEQAKRRASFERDSASIENKIASNLQMDFTKDIGDMIGDGDAAKIRAVTDSYEGLGRSLTNQIKQAEKLSESIRSSGQEAKKSIAETSAQLKKQNAELKKAADPAVRADLMARISMTKSVIANTKEYAKALELEGVRIEANIARLKERKVIANQMLSTLRQERRESEETAKANENAYRGAVKSRRALQVAMSNKILDGGTTSTGLLALDPNSLKDLKTAEKALSKLDSEVINTTTSIKQMEAAYQSQLENIYSRAKGREGEFSVFPDTGMTTKQQADFDDLIDKQIKGLIKKTQREIQSNEQAIASANKMRTVEGKAIEDFIAHAKAVQLVNSELKKQVGIQEKLKRARANLVSGTALLAAGESDLGYAEVKLSADAYRTLNREIESLITKMDVYQAEGGQLTADQQKAIQTLRIYQQETQKSSAGIDILVSAMKRQIDTMDKLRAKAAAALENPMMKIGASGLGLDYKDAQDVKNIKDAVSATRSELARLGSQKVQLNIEFNADTDKLYSDLASQGGIFSGKSSKEANRVYNQIMDARRAAHKQTMDAIISNEKELSASLKTVAADSNQDFIRLGEVFQKLVVNISNSEEMIRRFGNSSQMAMRALDANLVTDFDFGLSGLQAATSEMSRFAVNARKMANDIEMARLEGVNLDSSQEAVYQSLLKNEAAAVRFANSMGKMSKDIKLTKQNVDSLEEALSTISGNPVLSGRTNDLTIDFNLDLAKQGVKTIESSLKKIEQTEYDIKFKLDEELLNIQKEAASQLGRFSDLAGDTAAIENRRVKIVAAVTAFYGDQINRLQQIKSLTQAVDKSDGNRIRAAIKEEETTRKINALLEEGALLTARMANLQAKEAKAGLLSSTDIRSRLLKEVSSEAGSLGKRLEDISIKAQEFIGDLNVIDLSQQRAAEAIGKTSNSFKSFGEAIANAEKKSATFDSSIDKVAASVLALSNSSSVLSAGQLDLSIDFNFSEAKKTLNNIDQAIEAITQKKRLVTIEMSEDISQISKERRLQSGRFEGVSASDLNLKEAQLIDQVNIKYTERLDLLDKLEARVNSINQASGDAIRIALRQEQIQRSIGSEFDKIQKGSDKASLSILGINQAFTELSMNSNGGGLAEAIFGDISSRAGSAQKSIQDATLAIKELILQGGILTDKQKNLLKSTQDYRAELISLQGGTKSIETFLNNATKAASNADTVFRRVAANPLFATNRGPVDLSIKLNRDSVQRAQKDLEGLSAKIENEKINLTVEFNINKDKLKRDRQNAEGVFSGMANDPTSSRDQQQLDAAHRSAVAALTAEYMRSKNAIEATAAAAAKLYNDQSQDFIDLSEEIKGIEKLEQMMLRVDKTMTSIERNKARGNMATKMMGSSDNLEALSGLGQLQKTGSEARSLADEILKLDFDIRALTATNVKLTQSQQQKVDALLRERGALMQVDASVRKRNETLERQKRLEIELGQSLKLYNDRTADSIRHQFAFINALTVVTSVIFGVRMAFSELINESRAFARTLTVMESKTNDFATVYENLKTITREVSVEFGRSIEEVSEVVKQFGSAGFSAEEAMSALRSTTQLIVATNGDAETSARAVAGIYRVFGAELKKTGSDMAAFARINDVLLGVYKYHQAELDEMIQGFRFAGSASKMAGFSFSETSAMLAVLNDNMIKSGTAGRGLQVVMAQVASKADKFEDAFGVTINKGAPLTEQFISLLGQVNAQLGSGVYTVADLDKRFELFGLRGARSFAVLAEQFPAVLEAMQRLDKESKGLGNTLSQIVKNELATQFDAAKQALIGIAREFVEPAKGLLVIFVDLIKGARDLFLAFDPVSSVITSIMMFTAVIAAFLMTLKAVVTVLVVMGVQLKSVTSVLIGDTAATYANAAAHAFAAEIKAGASIAQSVSAAKLAGANTKLLASTNLVAGANTKMGIATAAGSMKLLAMVGVVAVLIGVLVYFSKTSRSLRSELDQLSGSLSTVENNLAELKRFEETIDTIQRSTLTPEAKANSVLQIMKNTNKELIRGGTLAGQNRDQIALNINTNLSGLKREADFRKKILDQKEKDLQLQVKLKALALADKDLTGFDLKKEWEQFDSSEDRFLKNLDKLHGVLNSNIFEGGLGSTTYLDGLAEKYSKSSGMAVELETKIASLKKRLDEPANSRSMFTDFQLSGMLESAEKELAGIGKLEKTYGQELDRVVKIITETATSTMVEGEKLEDAVNKVFETLIGQGRFSKTFADNVKSAIGRSLSVPVQFKLIPTNTLEIKDVLYSDMVEIINTIDAPINSSVFNEVAQGFVDIQTEVELAGKGIQQLQQLLFAFDTETNVSSKASDQYKKAKDLIEEKASDSKALNIEPINMSVRTDSVDGFIKSLENMGNIKTISITNEALMDMFTNIASIQDISDQSAIALSNSFWKNITDKETLAAAMFEEAGGQTVSSSEKMEVSVKDLAGAYLKTREAIRSLGNETESVLSLNASFAQNLAKVIVTQYLPEIEDGYRKLIGGIRGAIMSTTDLNPLEQMLNRQAALRQQLSAQGLKDGSKLAQIDDETAAAMAKASGDLLAIKIAQASIARGEAELQSLKDRVADAEEVVANASGNQEAQQAAEKALGALIETYKKLADIQKLNKDILLLKIQETAAQRKINQTISETIRFGNRSDSLSKVKIRSLNAEIQYTLQILEVQELLGRSQAVQQFFLSEILDNVNDILAVHDELLDSVSEEVFVRHEALSLIKASLDSSNKFAGVQDDITAKAAKLNRLLFSQGQLEKQLSVDMNHQAEIQSEIDNNLADQAKLLTDILSHKDKLKDLDDARLKSLENQHAVYKEIADLLGTEVSRAESAFSDSMSNRLKNMADDEKSARQLARAAGVSVNDAIYRREEVIENLFKRMKKDYIPTLGELSKEFLQLGNYITETAKRQEQFSKMAQSLAKDQSAIELDSYFMNLQRNTKESLEAAGNDLEKFKSLIGSAFTGDPEDPNFEAQIAALTLYINKRRELQEAESLLPNEANLNFLIAGLAPEEFFKVIEARLTGMISQFRAISDDKGLLAILQGEYQASFGLNESAKRSFELSVNTLVDALNRLTAAMATSGISDSATGPMSRLRFQVPGFATGGKIPGGYGGGDTVPAMLEPGEFVIPKHIVKKMGQGFFERLRKGSIPGFATGGLVGGTATSGASSMESFMGVLSDNISQLKHSLVNGLNSTVRVLKDINTKTNTAAIPRAMAAVSSSVNNGTSTLSRILEHELPSISKNTSAAGDRLNDSITTTGGIGQPMAEAVKKGLKGAMGQGKSLVDSVGGSTRGTQIIDATLDMSKQPTVKKEIEEWAERAKITGLIIDKALKVTVGGIKLIATEISGYLVPEFALENAKLRKQFLETIKQINIQYQQSVEGQVIALQRNESSYYSYLNAIQDAERTRQTEIMTAQEEYRASLKKTGQVMMEMVAGLSTSVLTGLGDLSSSIADVMADEMSTSIKGAISIPILSLGDNIESLFKSKTDPSTGNSTGGVGTNVKNASTGVADFFKSLNEPLATLDSLNTAGTLTAATMSFEEFANEVGSGMYDVLQQGVQLSTMLSGFALSAITDFVSQLVSMTTVEDLGESAVEFIEKFIEELPEAAPAFIDKLIENMDRLLTAISEGMPAIIDVLLEEAPRFLDALVTSLEKTLPRITEALADALPILIKKLVPILSRLVILVIQQIPTILGSIAESIPTLIISVIKELPSIAFELIKAILLAIPKMIGGLFSGIFGGIFHQGGVVNIPTKEALILAKKGEGVLTPETVRRIGGASAIQALNAGIDPNQLAPNIVDPMRLAQQTKIERVSPSQSQSNSIVNNSFSMSVPITGSETDKDLRAKADALIEMVDEGLAKLAEDRKSKFARRK